MRIVKNYIVAEEKVAKVARFSSQYFLPAITSAYKVVLDFKIFTTSCT